TTSIGTVNLNTAGTATLTTSSLSVGNHVMSASYAGDSNFNGSTSPAITQTVSADASSTTVMSSLNPSSVGQAVIFNAMVSAFTPGSGMPTGTVSFLDGSSTLGTANLNAGSASFTTSSLPGGSHTITAFYGGDTNFSSSTSPLITQTVTRFNSATTVMSSLNPSTFGQAVTFTATVSAATQGSGTPTGTVTFLDGTTTLGAATLNAGSASFTTSMLTGGSHNITASYAGDSNFNASTSTNTISQIVNRLSS